MTAAEVNLATPVLEPVETAIAGAPGLARAAAASSGGGGGDTFIEKQILELLPPAGGGLSDPRAHAVQLLTELRRSGRKGRR